jgi:hypothetical protein
MATPASAIKDEVHVLIGVQIDTFSQPTPLTSSQLRKFHHRSKKLQILCQELDRIGTRSRYRAGVGERGLGSFRSRGGSELSGEHSAQKSGLILPRSDRPSFVQIATEGTRGDR